MQEYSIDGHLLMAIKALGNQPVVSVHANGKHSKSFHEGVGLSPFHNLHEMDGQEQQNRGVCHDRKTQN